MIRKAYPWLLPLAFCCIVYSAINLPGILRSRPMGEHAWAQIDRASVALMYYRGQTGFFSPQTHSIARNPSGIAAGEFPLQPYIASGLYSLFGFHEIIFRLLVLFCSLAGFIAATTISFRLLKLPLTRTAASLAWLLSPNLIYYSTGFLPDTFALSLITLALMFLIFDLQRSSSLNFTLFLLFSALAMLEKSSVIFIYGIVCIGYIVQKLQHKKITPEVLRIVLPLLIPPLIAFAWILWASVLQRQHPSQVFLLGTRLPANPGEWIHYLKAFFGKAGDYYTTGIWLLAGACCLAAFVKPRAIPLFLRIVLILFLPAWLTFFTLLSKQAWFHGYYHIPFQLGIYVAILCGLMAFENRFRRKPFAIAAFMILLVLGADGVMNMQKFFRERAWHHQLICTDWYDAEPVLDAVGVGEDSKVLTYNDGSYNISLYLMNRRGWNSAADYRDSTIIEGVNDCGYMVLTDTDVLMRPFFKNFKLILLGRHRSLYIIKAVPLPKI